jgi:hypothetical protein
MAAFVSLPAARGKRSGDGQGRRDAPPKMVLLSFENGVYVLFVS